MAGAEPEAPARQMPAAVGEADDAAARDAGKARPPKVHHHQAKTEPLHRAPVGVAEAAGKVNPVVGVGRRPPKWEWSGSKMAKDLSSLCR